MSIREVKGDYKYNIQLLAEAMAEADFNHDENFDYFKLPYEKQLEYYERATKEYFSR